MSKKQNEKKILLVHGGIKRLAERMGCNPKTVKLALNGLANTELRREIRRIAYNEEGGVYAKEQTDFNSD